VDVFWWRDSRYIHVQNTTWSLCLTSYISWQRGTARCYCLLLWFCYRWKSLAIHNSSVTVIFAAPPANIRYGLSVLVHNSGHFGPLLPFWAPRHCRVCRWLVTPLIHKLVWWYFQVGWASGLQIVFLWDNTNTQKYVWLMQLKMTFFRFPKVQWLHLTGELDNL